MKLCKTWIRRMRTRIQRMLWTWRTRQIQRTRRIRRTRRIQLIRRNQRIWWIRILIRI